MSNEYSCIKCGAFLNLDKNYCDSIPGHPIRSSKDYIPTILLQDFTEMVLKISHYFTDDPLDMDETRHVADLIYRYISIQIDILDKHSKELSPLFGNNLISVFVDEYRNDLFQIKYQLDLKIMIQIILDEGHGNLNEEDIILLIAYPNFNWTKIKIIKQIGIHDLILNHA